MTDLPEELRTSPERLAEQDGPTFRRASHTYKERLGR